MKGGENIETYRCAVNNCGTPVKKPGVLCKNCIERYINDKYVISKCSECDKILDISEPNYIAGLIMEATKSRVLMSICKDCFDKVKDKPIYLDSIDPKDFEGLDEDEEDELY